MIAGILLLVMLLFALSVAAVAAWMMTLWLDAVDSAIEQVKREDDEREQEDID
jgi:uncharacterized protein involved in cysteine biosynthesis